MVCAARETAKSDLAPLCGSLYSRVRFLNLDTIDILTQISLCCGGAALTITGWLAASLASIHYLPVAPPGCDDQNVRHPQMSLEGGFPWVRTTALETSLRFYPVSNLQKHFMYGTKNSTERKGLHVRDTHTNRQSSGPEGGRVQGRV